MQISRVETRRAQNKKRRSTRPPVSYLAKPVCPEYQLRSILRRVALYLILRRRHMDTERGSDEATKHKREFEQMNYGTHHSDDRLYRSKGKSGLSLFVCLLTACCLQGFSSGYVFATSYYIGPVDRACTPPWPRGLTVYATAGMYLSQAAFGPVAGFIVRRSSSASEGPLVLSLVLTGVGFLLCGIPVYSCVHWGSAFLSEGVYVLGFLLLGAAISVQYLAVSPTLAYLLPNRLGLAGGLYGLTTSLGSIAFGQILVLLSEWRQIDAATMFFFVGIQSVALCAAATPPFAERFQQRAVKYAGPARVQSTGNEIRNVPDYTCLSLFKTSQYACMFLGVLTNSLAVIGILARLEPILNNLWGNEMSTTMHSLLSFLSLGAYTFGRVLWTGFSDHIGLTSVWRISLGGVSLFLLIVGFTEANGGWVPVALLCVYLLFATAPKVICPGMCFQYFGMNAGTLAIGLLTIAFGIGGAAGPFLIQMLYQHFGHYKEALLVYAGVNFLSFFASFFMNCSRMKLPTEVT